MQRILTADAAPANWGPELPTPGLTVAMNWTATLKR